MGRTPTNSFTEQELSEALRAIGSIIRKCRKAQEKFPQGVSQHTLLERRLQAMYIARSLIRDALGGPQ